MASVVGKRRRLVSAAEEPKQKKRKTQHVEEEEEVEFANGANNLSDSEDNEDMSEEEESEDEEILNGSASQRTGERGGTIREVVLENFMCHKHLRTTLKPKINFLTGPNGSKQIQSKYCFKQS